MSDLLYQVRLFRGGSPVDEFDPTMNKELRLPLELEQDVEYQVQVNFDFFYFLKKNFKFFFQKFSNSSNSL